MAVLVRLYPNSLKSLSLCEVVLHDFYIHTINKRTENHQAEHTKISGYLCNSDIRALNVLKVSVVAHRRNFPILRQEFIALLLTVSH